MLAITYLKPTEPTKKYSMLFFTDKQCKKAQVKLPVIIFAQSLDIKSYEIISPKLSIFPRSALEAVYVPTATEHMLPGKAYSLKQFMAVFCQQQMFYTRNSRRDTILLNEQTETDLVYGLIYQFNKYS